MNAVLLLAHGARNADWALPFQAIRERLIATEPAVPVELAFLDFIAPDFATACDRLAASGATRVVVCPLFLGVGGHVARDVPSLIESARSRWPSIAIESTPTLGEDAGVLQAIVEACLGHVARR